MDAEETTGSGRRRLRLAAVLGAAALAVPGGALIGNAFAADSGPAATPQQVQDERPAPPDGERRDGRDCPKDGRDGGGEGASGESGSGASGTAL